MNKLLILYKTVNFNNISELTMKYNNMIDQNCDSYYIVCDESLDTNIKIDSNIIYFKIKENNWDSILIKVINALQYFKNMDYTHVCVSNISTFINIHLLYNNLSSDACCAHIGHYSYNNINYPFPSGALYVLNINTVRNICNFFTDNNFIIENKLTKQFLNNYPSTDDIFFGFLFHLNNVKINLLKRYDILSENHTICMDYTHYRIKTGNNITDYSFHKLLYDKIYS